MPLVDRIYSLSDISNPDDSTNTISIDSTSNTFLVVMDTMIIPEEDPITVGDELFFIPSSELSIPAIDPIRINSNDITIDPVTQLYEKELNTLMPDFDGDCLSSQFFPGYKDSTSLEYDFNEKADFSSYAMINSVHYITIDEGIFSLSVDNTLPWSIDNFTIKIKDTIEDTVWAELSLDNREEDLSGKQLPGSLTLTFETLFEISGNPNSILSDPCIQNLDFQLEYSECSELDYTEPDCFSCSATGFDTLGNLCNEILTENDCVNQSDNAPSEFAIPSTDITVQNPYFSWKAGFCYLSVDGLSVTDEASLNTEIIFNIDGLESITADIGYEEKSDDTIDFQLSPGVSIIKAHIANAGLEDPDANKFIMEIENHLFSNVEIDFTINEFFETDDEDEISFLQNQIIPKDETNEIIYNFSDYIIKNIDGSDVNELSFQMSISIMDDFTTIDLDKDYSIDISANLNSFELDKINVKLEEFTTPPLPVASIPAGFSDFSLPTLSFNLLFYNQINVPVQLILDLQGITGEDIMTIHVEPFIQNLGFSDIDTTTLSFVADTMFTIQNGEIIDRTGLTDIYDSTRSVSIYELFSYDELNINGRASLVGEGDLERGKSLWADVKISIDPLTLILPNNISIITQDPTPFPMLQESTASEINNTITYGELNFEVINSMPISGKINLLLSNSNYTPICFDTLATITDIETRGLFSRIEGGVSDSCFNVMKRELYIDVVDDADSIIVYPDEYNGTHYVEIKRMSDGKIFYFGKLLEVFFNEPQLFTNDGIIIEPSISSLDPIPINTEKLEWLTRREDMFIVPNIIIMNSVSEDNPTGYLTFQTTNYMHIKSFLTLTLDSKGIINNDSPDEAGY